MRKLLLILILIIFQFSNFYCQNSIDLYLDGLSECIEKNELDPITSLFDTINKKVLNLTELDSSENPYYDFSIKFCKDEIGKEFFVIEKDSKLDILIQKALETKFWNIEKLSSEKPIIIGAQEVEIISPQGNSPKLDAASIEKIRLDPETDFISCSHLFTLNKTISTYYKLYKRLGVANSKVKLCGLYGMIEKQDFKLNSVKYFMVIDVVLQKMLNENKYEKYLTEK